MKFKWTQVEQDDFKKIKRIVAHDNLSTYLDFNKTFKIYTNDRAFQLGAVIIQKVKPIYFYSRKMTDTQQRYTVTDRELPSIVETLKEFRNILNGNKLRIYTDNVTSMLDRKINTMRLNRSCTHDGINV